MKKKMTLIMFVAALGITGCGASWNRAIKSWNSEVEGGLNRTLVVYDYNGDKLKEYSGKIDIERRKQLMSHHTATHIVSASCKRTLGPHVWQNGAKKTEEMAHLDITHYKSLTYEEERAIQNMANRIVLEGHHITKSWINKAEAEKKYGFTLYQ
jgi:alanyl-tRNA synthetase